MRKPSALAPGRRQRGGDAFAISTHGSGRRGLGSPRFLVLVATVFLVLVVAATTQASSGVVGYFKLGGEFEGSLETGALGKLAGIAVNASGTGGASPGDVYAFGSSVRQLSAADNLIRDWGANTVKSGPGQADETQAVRVDATGGTFRLSFGAGTTGDISVTATAAQIEAALNGLTSIGASGVSVTGGPGDAGGTNPYIVTFNGAALADTDQPQLKAVNGGAPLSGGGAVVNTYTTNTGGSGREICQPDSGDECRDTGPSTTGGIAVDQPGGNVYVTDNNSVEKYSATGQFLRAWGRDVVAAGPDDSSVNEVKSVTVKATGGTFTLSYRKRLAAPVESTPPLPYNSSPAAIETALNNFAEIGGAQSSVSVTGGPGDLAGSSPYLITFHGVLGGDDLGNADEQSGLASNPSGLEISSGSKSAEVKTVADGGGHEICTPEDACKEGAYHEFGESSGPLSIRSFGSSLAVAPAGAPNAGDLVVGNLQRHRVQEYTSSGAFVRTFGWDVDETQPSTGFEVCTAESGDICKRGGEGEGVGQFGSLGAVSEDSSGAIYTVDEVAAGGSRVQKFTPAGGLNLNPSLFGSSETQALTVNAGAGQFHLTFGAEKNGTTGTGDITKGSTTITNVTTTSGEFVVGKRLASVTGGFFETDITGVGPNTLTVSAPFNFSESNAQLVSDRPYKTSILSYNASASEVKGALDALGSVNAEGGSVSVTGGPGSPGGPSPYLITFDGGRLARTDLPLIEALSGPVPLSGGSGAAANTASVTTTIPGGPNGIEPRSGPLDVDVAPGDRILVTKFFPRGFTKCTNGAVTPFEIRIQELDSSGAVIETSDPCTGLEGYSASEGRRSSLTVNALTGHPYLLNQNLNRLFVGPHIVVFGLLGPAPSLILESVSSIGTTGGTISGTVNPNGPGTSYPDTTGTPSAPKTTYRVEFKKASDPTWTAYTSDTPIGSGTSPVHFSVGVGGLEPKTEYDIRVVVVKPFTTSVEDEGSFTTAAAAPEIAAFSSSNVTVDSADLKALINPQGSETSYHFEYGTTPAYGASTPQTSIGESHQGQSVQDHIEGLQDAVYHFRVIATNASGTTTSADQTFTFHPPVCPNQTVRQQTGAAYLPDCRAYELVSPENAGGTTLFPGGPQGPYASNPPRLAFVGQLAAIPGSGRNPINTAGDLYIATRGAEGWHTRYVGPSSEEVGCVGGRPLVSGTGNPTTIQNDVIADSDLSRIIDWNLGNPLWCYWGAKAGLRFSDRNTAARGSNAPYLWNANGDFLDRWPTSTADVPGSAANFDCPQDPAIHPYPLGAGGIVPVSYFCSTFVDASKDLSHFVFSTQSGLFGEDGLTKAPGSAYDNDTADNTLRLISKQPNGEAIGQEPGAKAGPEELIRFPAVSADGSHILMSTTTKPACRQLDYPGSIDLPLCPIVTQPTHLYMRVDDAVTYDVSAGKAVHYFRATPDATKVYFTSDEQLTPDDTDESTDLYMWSENGGSPQLTRISVGDAGSVGNTDECVSTWTTDCDVQTYNDSAISSTNGNQGGAGSWTDETTNPGYTDNAIAAKTGDIYFYSPEQLVSGKGVPGKENLYVYRQGSVRLVATLEPSLPYCLGEEGSEVCSNGAAARLQVTPDGRFAAFVTTSNLTGYDSHGFGEMYRYNAETENIICVSCRPDGSAPIGHVLGSQGGRFITDDGRTFFNSPDALDPSDTNVGIGAAGKPLGYDVYEYVEGRPQLISTGTGTTRDSRGAFSVRSQSGLYGVSADGVDVYFGTTDRLVGQDRNGNQLKFYDARTNGGFSFVPPPAPCAAADECHGPASTPPAPLANGTGSALGAGGNARNRRHHKKKQHRRHGKRAAHNHRGGVR